MMILGGSGLIITSVVTTTPLSALEVTTTGMSSREWAT